MNKIGKKVPVLSIVFYVVAAINFMGIYLLYRLYIRAKITVPVNKTRQFHFNPRSSSSVIISRSRQV